MEKERGGARQEGGTANKRMKRREDKREYGKFLTSEHSTPQKPMFSLDVFQKMDFKIMCELNNNHMFIKRPFFQRANSMKHAGSRECPRGRQGPGQKVEGKDHAPSTQTHGPTP